MSKEQARESQLGRRQALKVSGAAAAGGLLAGWAGRAGQALAGAEKTAAARLTAEACMLTPEQGEGPYHLDVDLVRRDIREGQAGTPLRLTLQLFKAEDCTPLSDAVIDIWHAAADGSYSGYRQMIDDRLVDTRGQTYLRGIQVSDQSGSVSFRTVYPGWYPGRAVHIHFKIHLGQRQVVVSQLYFPDAVSDGVYRQLPYASRSPRSQRNQDDGVLEGTNTASSRLVAAVTDASDGLTASLQIVVSV